MSVKKVRWGIAGLGNIAQRFADDLVKQSSHCVLHGVASRDALQAEAFARHYHCAKGYSSYLDLALDPDVDIVYVATIHPFHKQLALLFLQYGKHVLVEKPAFTNYSDYCEVTEYAHKKGLLLIEAMKSVAFPTYQKLVNFLQQHSVKLTYIEAAFGSVNLPAQRPRLFDKKLSGGATLDVGVYPLWLYCDLLRVMQCPLTKPQVNISTDHYQLGVDETVEFIFAGEIRGKLTASITQELPRFARILGADIEIVIHGKWWNPKHVEITYQGKRYDINEVVRGGGFQYEINHVAKLVLKNKVNSEIINNSVTAQVIKIMEESLQANGLGHLLNTP